MTRPRLALVGTGKIASFHVAAALAEGFEISAVCASYNSSSAKLLAAQLPAASFIPNPLDIFEENWDAAIICSPHDNLFAYLTRCISDGRPAIVEKPGALRSADLISLENDKTDHIFIGFNRRFYETVGRFQRAMREAPPGTLAVEIPETVPFSGSPRDDPYRAIYLNSVHMLDLALYLSDGLQILHLLSAASALPARSCNLLAKSSRGDIVSIQSKWNSPANSSIRFDGHDQRLVLEPLETYSRFTGMNVLDPSPEYPVRRYLPNKVDELQVPSPMERYKVGFREQIRALRTFLERGTRDVRAASVADAGNALAIAEALIGRTYREP